MLFTIVVIVVVLALMIGNHRYLNYQQTPQYWLDMATHWREEARSMRKIANQYIDSGDTLKAKRFLRFAGETDARACKCDAEATRIQNQQNKGINNA